MGTVGHPFCSIEAAAAKVTAGQTVQVASGVYPEIVTVARSGKPNAPIVLTAAPGATVVVRGRLDARGEPGAAAFRIWRKRWIRLNGFTVTHTSGYGIDVQDSSQITLTNNHVSYSGRPASGRTRSGISLSNVSDSLVAGNTVDHSTSYGINVVAGSAGNVVEGNLSFSNAQGYQRAASGIRVYESPRNRVSANVVYDNEDSGIEFDHANDSVATDNVSFNNGDHGIDTYASIRARLISNTVYKNVTAGIDVEGSSTAATIMHNVSVDNALGGPRNRGNIRVEASSTPATTMDYDQVYVSNPDILLIWDNLNYTTLADFQTATSQEPHGLQANPDWISCELKRKTTVAELRFRSAGTNACASIQTARR